LTAGEAALLAAAPVDCSDIPELPSEFWNTAVRVLVQVDHCAGAR